MAKDVYAQTSHTRQLSQWRIRIPGVFNLKPFNFFLKNDSRNLSAVNNYSLAVAVVLNSSLFFALTLPDTEDIHEPPDHARILKKKTKAKKHDSDDSEGRGDYMSWPVMLAEWTPYIDVMGFLYTLMMLSAMLVVIATYSPLQFRELESTIGEEGPALFPVTLAVLFLAGALFFGVYSGAGLHATFAGVVAILMLLFVGGGWAGAPMSCPNNFVAKVIATAASSMNTQAVGRRVFLVAASICGNLELYFFLLVLAFGSGLFVTDVE
jgi:hypothetical protein